MARDLSQQLANLQQENERLRREVADRRPDERLRLEEERYRSLVQAITAIVWNTPASGEFETEQPGWSAFTGQSFAELSGWGWLNAVHPDDRPNTARVWSAAVASRSLYHVEHRLRRHDGQYRHMLVRAVPILNDARDIREWVGVHTDVTEQKLAEAALREAKAAAESANRTKSEFLANMSHEIRTPMNGILGMTELLLNTRLTPQQHEYLGTVKTSADSLLRLLNDILDFSKIEAGKLELESIDFPLRDSLGDAMHVLAMRAAQKGLELAYHIAPDVPDRLRGDPGRLRQIIINLVGNAIKFTEKGEVVVAVNVEGPIADDVELHFSVSDTGIGIPADKLQHIFEPFKQADSSTTRRYGGTGLGLTISTQLVTMMGGRTWVESEVGRGAVFHFRVRFGLAHAAALSARPAALEGMRVLVVDDNHTNRRILQGVLTGWSMTPTLADGWRTALAAIDDAVQRDRPFRLALLDVMMPEMDGFDLAQAIRQRSELDGCALLMLSSAGQAVDTERCRELRIAGCLIKPTKQSDLREAILAATRFEEGSLAAAKDMAPAVAPRKVLLAEDGLVNQQVAVGLLALRGHQVVVVNNGKEALAALERATFDVVLMDVQMPEMDGLQATAAIRAREKETGRRLPIIAMTAHAMKGDRDNCLQAGMDGYVSKPFQAQALYEVVEQVPASSLAEKVAECPAAECPAAECPAAECPGAAHPSAEALSSVVAVEVVDWPAALKRVQGRSDMLRTLVSCLMKEIADLMPQVRAAAARQDMAALVRPAHTLRGAAGACAAGMVQDAAGRMEALARAGDSRGLSEMLAALEAEVGRLLPVLATFVEGKASPSSSPS